MASLVVQGNIEAEANEAKKKLKKLLAKLEIPEDVVSTINELGLRFYKEDNDDDVVEFLNDAISKAAMRMMVLYVVLFWEAPEKFGLIVKNKSDLLKNFAEEPKDQLAQLIGLEFVLSMMISDRMKELPQILKVLYDEDIIDEDVIVAWYDRPSAGQKTLGISEEGGAEIRNVCKEFVEWIQEDEESEDDDDEEEEDD